MDGPARDSRPNWRRESDAVTEVGVELVRELVSTQFPRWRGLPVEPVARQGWDNRTFRLGQELAVRLPSGEAYVAGLEKEDRWLSLLSKHLPLPVPVPVATGQPGSGYPYPWSVRDWIPGVTADADEIDRRALAADLGGFLRALYEVPAHDGPACGRHSHFRGCHPSVYSDQVQLALDRLAGEVDVRACREIWARALTTVWRRPPVWVHGDVAVGNLLTRDGRLSAVIDFGTCATGDPACDLVLAWTFFAGDERKLFRESVGLPEDAWLRARGWALWKALATMAGLSSPDPEGVQARALAQVFTDPVIG
jgi:aminoglycoside phosphotransferase (APT) family kinase protein